VLLYQSLHCDFVLHSEVLSPLPTPKPKDHPLSVVRDCLFSIFAATLHVAGRSFHLQPEDSPCRGDTDPFIVGSTLIHLYNLKP